MADSNAFWTWELDTDITQLEPVDLKADFTVLNNGNGAYGSVANENNPDLTNGFSVFAPVMGTCYNEGNPCTDNSDCTNICKNGELCSTHDDCGGPTSFCDFCYNSVDNLGKLGNNRQAKNSCFFGGEFGIKPPAMATLGLPEPEDDDIDNDTDGTIDEYVSLTGPVRNMDIYAFNGPDMRWSTLEDIYGDTGQVLPGRCGHDQHREGCRGRSGPRNQLRRRRG